MSVRNMSDCLPQTTPKEDEDRFCQLLKHGAEQKPPGDTEEKTVGVNPDPYPDPDRAEENIDAPWGEKDISSSDNCCTAQHHSNAVLGEFRKGREDFLNRYFAGKGASEKATKAQLAQHLDHAKSGDYESGRAMLREGSKRNPAVADTLLDKTKKELDTY